MSTIPYMSSNAQIPAGWAQFCVSNQGLITIYIHVMYFNGKFTITGNIQSYKAHKTNGTKLYYTL